MFRVFLQVLERCFNPYTRKHVCLRFWSILWFFQFLGQFVLFLASQWTSLLLSSKQIQQNYNDFFNYFQPRSALYGLMRLRLLVKMHFMDIILALKVTMNIVRTLIPCFGSFRRFVTRALTI